MNALITVMLLIQIVATPIADGTVLVSSDDLQFPELPEGADPGPINDDWELLYYEVAISSDEYVIRGEIRNISSNPLSTPTLIVTTADGSQIGIHPDIDKADAGGRVPFQQNVYDEDITAALNQSLEIEFIGVCEFYNVIPHQDFAWTFEDVEVEYDAERSAVRASGTVTNVSGVSVEHYAPMLFGFTADGRYVGSVSSRDAPSTILSGDRFDFEMDHGFDSYHSNEPFNGAGRDAIFVLAMAPPTYVSMNCVG